MQDAIKTAEEQVQVIKAQITDPEYLEKVSNKEAHVRSGKVALKRAEAMLATQRQAYIEYVSEMQRGAMLAQQGYESKNLSYLTPADIGVSGVAYGSIDMDKILEVSSQELNAKESSASKLSKVKANKQQLKYRPGELSLTEPFADKTFATPNYGQSYIEKQKVLIDKAVGPDFARPELISITPALEAKDILDRTLNEMKGEMRRGDINEQIGVSDSDLYTTRMLIEQMKTGGLAQYNKDTEITNITPSRAPLSLILIRFSKNLKSSAAFSPP